MLTTKNTKSSVAYFSLCALCELCGAVFRRLCKADIFSYHKEHEGHKENVSRQLFQSFKPFKSLRTFGCLYRFARLSRLSRRLRPCALDLVPLTLRALRFASIWISGVHYLLSGCKKEKRNRLPSVRRNLPVPLKIRTLESLSEFRQLTLQSKPGRS